MNSLRLSTIWSCHLQNNTVLFLPFQFACLYFSYLIELTRIFSKCSGVIRSYIFTLYQILVVKMFKLFIYLLIKFTEMTLVNKIIYVPCVQSVIHNLHIACHCVPTAQSQIICHPIFDLKLWVSHIWYNVSCRVFLCIFLSN